MNGAIIIARLIVAVICFLIPWALTYRTFFSSDVNQQAPMDLVWQAGLQDPNGLPQNPQWVWQVTHPNSVPDPTTICDAFPYKVPNDPDQGFLFGNPPCVSQAVSVDYPFGFQDFICSNFGGGTGKLHGHVNWIPARYDGVLSWKSFNSWPGDRDYNFEIVPPNNGGLTKYNDEFLSMEFDSRETINHFGTPWWSKFRNEVDNGDPTTMVSHNYAIAIGLLGVDSEHQDHSELHPVYALAIHTSKDPNDDTWAIFARNWGSEGYCSQNQHLLSFQNNQIGLLLPADPAAGQPQLLQTTAFQSSSSDVTWSWARVPQGVLFTANLRKPEDHSRINGEIHFKWSGGAAGPAHHGFALTPESIRNLASQTQAPMPQSTEPAAGEEKLAEILNGLPQDQRNQFKSQIEEVPSHVVLDTTPTRKVAPNLPKHPHYLDYFLLQPALTLPAESTPRDEEKLARDRRQTHVICELKRSNPEFAPQIPMEICNQFDPTNR